ncbi:phage terminase large subunit family protein [Paenibacillus sp. GCM10012307]|uniref:Phage terminase large subunit family protein n=1 Tax=Paenibacillus roseus TaxID=2798579 RepID=A0A934MPI4_9BACL|nr:phage terminase large subunit family protein [Paenibacillus roseus]MBJ6362111.1 phage terminase large subunit family protein [Paenibacillus roseus]
MTRIKKNVREIFRAAVRLVAPPPLLTVSEWADDRRRLSPEASSEPGQWRTDRAPYQRGIMDAINDPYIETVIVMSSAQVGKTEFLLNMIGFHIDYDPAPIMLVQPTLDLAQAYSKDRLAPMLRDSPALRGKVKDVKSKDSGNTLLHKIFPGGHITMAGSNSPASLASRPIRILLLDEVDRYPVSAGTEGDPVSLATRRTETFWNRKRVLVSTPTIKGASRIEFAYNDSTMEQWCLPCPSCGESQPLKWEQLDFDSVHMACKECGALHGEQEWKDGKGQWIARQESEVRGFHLNALASPWKRWSEIIRDFKEAKRGGPEMLKSFVNTVLGETWEEEGEQLEEEELMKRCEEYNADVPEAVKILTAAVDVQDDRFEIEVIGWGAGKESWGITYHKIFGDLRQPEIWAELDQFLLRTWENKNGLRFAIACTCMDSGGHYTTEVYRFCAIRESRRVFAIKGQGAQNGEYVPLINGNSRTPREKAVLFKIGVDEGKGKVFSSLKIEDAGPGYCHFPSGNGYNAQYFKGLTAEKLQTRYKSGVAYRVWKKVRDRNEPLDLRVYNTAALEILNPQLDVPLSIHDNRNASASKRINKKRFVKKSKLW